MPRGKNTGSDRPEKWVDPRSQWALDNPVLAAALRHWDVKEHDLWQAVAAVLESGSTVVFRPGAGGRVVGIAIWEKSKMHPPVWCYDSDEIDVWSGWVLMKAGPKDGEPGDEA